VTRLLCFLATTLVLVAAAGCSGDDGGEAAGTGETVAATTAEPAPVESTTATTTAEPDPADPTATRPEAAPDQSRWAAQVDAACKPWQEQIDQLPAPADAAGLESWLDDLLPLVRRELAAVKAVKRPAKQSEAQTAARFIENLTQLERSLTRYRAAIVKGDDKAVGVALVEANAAGAAARNFALVLGITECGGYSGG
jgi:hypothetical protein